MAVRVPRHVTVFYSQTVFTDLVSSMPAKESSLCFWALGDLDSDVKKNTSSFVHSYRVFLTLKDPRKELSNRNRTVAIGGSLKGHPEPFKQCWVVISGLLAARIVSKDQDAQVKENKLHNKRLQDVGTCSMKVQ